MPPPSEPRSNTALDNALCLSIQIPLLLLSRDLSTTAPTSPNRPTTSTSTASNIATAAAPSPTDTSTPPSRSATGSSTITSYTTTTASSSQSSSPSPSTPLSTLHAALHTLCPTLPLTPWEPTTPPPLRPHHWPQDSNASQHTAWASAERKRWDAAVHSGMWIMRGASSSSPSSPSPPSTPTSAPTSPLFATPSASTFLDAVEVALLSDMRGVHTVPFTLERYAASIWRLSHVQAEIDAVLGALARASGFVMPGVGVVWVVVCGGWCLPTMAVHLPCVLGSTLASGARQGGGGGGVGDGNGREGEQELRIDKRVVADLFVLLAGFEREMLAVQGVGFVVRQKMVSGGLADVEVQRVRGEWGALERSVERSGGEWGGVADGVKRERIEEWLAEIGERDEKRGLRERVLGVEGGGWFAWVGERGNISDVIREFASGKGKGGAVGVLLRGSDRDEEEQERRSVEDDVVGITFSIPRFSTSVAVAPLVAYIDLLHNLFVYAYEARDGEIKREVTRIREGSRLNGESPASTLAQVASLLQMDKQHAEVLIQDAERNWQWDMQRDGVGTDTGDELFDLFLRWEREEFALEKGHLRGFLQRYEHAGGFAVPPGKKVLAMMGEK